ncbi:integumentary mucin C.1-like isoform X1 [Mercenaria mercenaria]|uniref:integumentary mucin C.1-like isoform X1 n=1 Tax=Mercenaria mercenaria TaxID=6596 RepID=UPI00234ED5EF|nr:integumentary mucin C.1-like isoform X1 [Mercenaria mercenaria]
MFAIVFCNMIFWILIVSVTFQGVTCNLRYPNLNQGSLLQQVQKNAPSSWRNIWTTLSPPATPRPRRLTVYDTIRATAAASRRVNGIDSYHQAIISPASIKSQPVFPTKETSRYSPSIRSSSKRVSQENTGQYRPAEIRPTAETRFSNVQAAKGPLLARGATRAETVSDLGARRRSSARTNTAMARRTHSVKDKGLYEEAGMFDTSSASHNVATTGHFDAFAGDAIALYAYDHDHGHGHGTTTATGNKYVRTSTILEANTPVKSRFKVLPNGSIVDYGISSQTYTQQNSHATSPNVRGLEPSAQSSTAYAKKQTQPTSTDYLSSSTTNIGQSGSRQSSPTNNQLPLSDALPASPTRSSVQTTRHNRPLYTNAQGGVPIFDDSLSYVMDDPRLRKDDHHSSLSIMTESGIIDYFPTQTTNITLGQTSPARKITTVKTSPTTTTTIPTTTTTKATTTTTTTATTTTTTPKPKPKDDYWTKQGGVPIDITVLNDTHVCPSSRARWQDYTLYLETKPRLCMIQITFNARYKREPIYHNTWWGNSVEWVYRTVYEPDVKFVDNYQTQLNNRIF